MQYVSFLRAINVGNRRLKMVDLADFFESCGFADVSTFIASGNVVFTSRTRPDVPAVEASFAERFGFSSETFLRTATEVQSILARVPWTPTEGTVEVSFLSDLPDPAAARQLELTAVRPEQLSVSDSEVFFLRVGGGVPTRHKEATSMRILDLTMTRRGLSTVLKIRDKFLLADEA